LVVFSLSFAYYVYDPAQASDQLQTSQVDVALSARPPVGTGTDLSLAGEIITPIHGRPFARLITWDPSLIEEYKSFRGHVEYLPFNCGPRWMIVFRPGPLQKQQLIPGALEIGRRPDGRCFLVLRRLSSNCKLDTRQAFRGKLPWNSAAVLYTLIQALDNFHWSMSNDDSRGNITRLLEFMQNVDLLEKVPLVLQPKVYGREPHVWDTEALTGFAVEICDALTVSPVMFEETHDLVDPSNQV